MISVLVFLKLCMYLVKSAAATHLYLSFILLPWVCFVGMEREVQQHRLKDRVGWRRQSHPHIRLSHVKHAPPFLHLTGDKIENFFRL